MYQHRKNYWIFIQSNKTFRTFNKEAELKSIDRHPAHFKEKYCSKISQQR